MSEKRLRSGQATLRQQSMLQNTTFFERIELASGTSCVFLDRSLLNAHPFPRSLGCLSQDTCPSDLLLRFRGLWFKSQKDSRKNSRCATKNSFSLPISSKQQCALPRAPCAQARDIEARINVCGRAECARCSRF
jgi:hypothetical protein